MRNGNAFAAGNVTQIVLVLTVPMRNGNKSILSIVWSMGGFLPYL